MAYDFETGTQGWSNNGQGACPDSHCYAQWVGFGRGQTEIGPVFAGQGARKYHLNNTGGNGYFEVSHYPPDSGVEPVQIGPHGTVVDFAVWIPKGTAQYFNAIQAFAKTGSSNVFNREYVGNYALVEDAWTVYGVYLPPDSASPVQSVGLAFDMQGTMNDDIYMDSVSYFYP